MKKATTKRKNDHLKMAAQSQTPHQSLYGQLSYEPLFGSPQLKERDYLFLGKKLKAPLWVSSMTGGGEKSGVINQRLAQVVAEFELGMGLGSCRLLLESKTPKKVWQHFNLRPTLGKERPFYANLGIAQVEKLLEKNELNAIEDMVGRLAADGLIIHINPLQEFLQPEGDRYRRPAIDTIKEFLEKTTLKVMVKEVGQGMGPLSIDALLRLPLAGLELAAFGGTNFAKLELLRASPKGRAHNLSPLSMVGHSALEMVQHIRSRALELKEKACCKDFIISGGVRDFLEGHMLRSTLLQSPQNLNAVVGHAYAFLIPAQKSYQELKDYVQSQVDGYRIAQEFLALKD